MCFVLVYGELVIEVLVEIIKIYCKVLDLV